jgi:hypothetical protein
VVGVLKVLCAFQTDLDYIDFYVQWRFLLDIIGFNQS